MECRNIREKLSDYADNQLSAKEKKLVDGHLKACQKCSHALEELRKIIAHTQGLDEAEPPPWLEQNVMAELRDNERRKEGFLQKLLFPVHTRFPVEIIATIAIVVTAFFVFRAVEPDLERRPRKQAAVRSESDMAISEDKKYKAKEGLLLKQDIKEPPVASAPAKRKMPMAESEAPSEKVEALEEQVVLDQELMLQRQYEIQGQSEIVGEKTVRDQYEIVDKKAERGRMAFAPGTAGTFEKENQIIHVTVRVKNIEISLSRIEKVIKGLKGEVVKIEHLDDKDILSVILESGRINELRKELKVIGDVDEILPESLKDKVEVKIEIIK